MTKRRKWDIQFDGTLFGVATPWFWFAASNGGYSACEHLLWWGIVIGIPRWQKPGEPARISNFYRWRWEWIRARCAPYQSWVDGGAALPL